MTADLSREEIERLDRDLLDRISRGIYGDAPAPIDVRMWLRVVKHLLSEPTRLAAARAEGYREGVAKAEQWCRVQAYCANRREQEADTDRAQTAERIVKQTLNHAADCFLQIASEPPPAKPAQPDDGWIEWKGGECPVEPDAVVEVRMRDGRTATFDDGTVDEFWWGNDGCSVDIIAYRIVKPAEPSAPVAPDWPTRCAALEADGISARKRIATLKAENAALRERAKLVVAALHGPGASARQLVTAVDGLRALLQGGADAATV